MPALKFSDILTQIRSGSFAPVYFLWGEEDYYIDRLTEIFENELLDETQKEFDFSLFFGQDLKGKEPGLKGVMAHCKQFPVMAPFQLILVKEAQAIDRWDALENYLQKPVATTVLVFSHKHKKIDKRKAVFKLIDKVGVSFESVPLKDREYGPWISNFLKEKGYPIQPQALALLSESIGSNLNLIVNELSKLFINLPQGTAINEDHIEQYIGINKEYNVFTLEKALSDRNLVQSRKICNHIRKNIKDFPPQFILTQLYRHFSRILQIHAMERQGVSHNEWPAKLGIPPYFIHQYEAAARNYSYRDSVHILHLIEVYDLKSKGVDSNVAPEDIIDELAFRILHAI